MSAKISEIMSTTVILAKPSYTIRNVRERLGRHRIHDVPVVDSSSDKIVRGIITSADLSRFSSDETPVERAMSDDVKTLSADTEASEAARLMRTHKIHHLVITDQDRVIGIVSSLDLLSLLE